MVREKGEEEMENINETINANNLSRFHKSFHDKNSTSFIRAKHQTAFCKKKKAILFSGEGCETVWSQWKETFNVLNWENLILEWIYRQKVLLLLRKLDVFHGVPYLGWMMGF